jgi:hypothetical protein
VPLDHETVAAINEAAEKAALRTLEVMLLHVGVDIGDQDEMRGLRERFEFLKRMHRGANEVKSAATKAVVKTCVGALLTGLLALIVMGVRDWLGRP